MTLEESRLIKSLERKLSQFETRVRLLEMVSSGGGGGGSGTEITMANGIATATLADTSTIYWPASTTNPFP